MRESLLERYKIGALPIIVLDMRESVNCASVDTGLGGIVVGIIGVSITGK